jgi:hypothetical protein
MILGILDWKVPRQVHAVMRESQNFESLFALSWAEANTPFWHEAAQSL